MPAAKRVFVKQFEPGMCMNTRILRCPVEHTHTHTLQDPVANTHVLEDRRQRALGQQIAAALQQTGCDTGGRQHVCTNYVFCFFSTKLNFQFTHAHTRTETQRGALARRRLHLVSNYVRLLAKLRCCAKRDRISARMNFTCTD